MIGGFRRMDTFNESQLARLNALLDNQPPKTKELVRLNTALDKQEQQLNRQRQQIEEQKKEIEELEEEVEELGEPKKTYGGYDMDKVVIPKDIERKLNELYYEKNYLLGRDLLWEVLKSHMPKRDKILRVYVEKWLNQQKVNQIFRRTYQSKGVGVFVPVKPFHDMSVDLIDFTNKPASNKRYIFVCVDNFSRYLYTEAIKDKTASSCGEAMNKILKKIKGKHPKADIKYILSDDGAEFKGKFSSLLTANDIRNVRTLAGQPQSNGLVERHNGKLKMILSKMKYVNGKNWVNNLPKATDVVNTYPNTSTGYTATDALKLDRDGQRKLIENVKKSQKESKTEPPKPLEVGTRVRIKIPKGKLDKMSDPNWYDQILKIREVVKNRRTGRVVRYRVTGKDDDKLYTKNDLQVIREETLQEPPERNKVVTRQDKEIEEKETTTQTRSKTKRRRKK